MKYTDYTYKRIDPLEVKSQMETIIDGFNNTKDVKQQKKWMDKTKILFSDYETYASIAHLNFNRNTKDVNAAKENDYYDKIDPSMKGISLNWAKTLLKGKFRKGLEEIYGSHFFNLKELELKSFDIKIKKLVEEENITKLVKYFQRYFNSILLLFLYLVFFTTFSSFLLR